MTQSSRKFVGMFAIVGSLVVYSFLAVGLYELLPGGMPNWLIIIYFAIAGIGWTFPAAWLIRWMSRPDEPEA